MEDAKRIRVMGDIPMELVNEVMMTITDPAAMLGPEVSTDSPGTVSSHCYLSQCEIGRFILDGGCISLLSHQTFII